MRRIYIAVFGLAISFINSPYCFADLFAALTGDGGIVRIDFDAKQVVEVYPVADLLLPVIPPTGMTFDGNYLYVGQTLVGAESLITPIEVGTGLLLPPVPIDPILGPNGETPRIVGLGLRDDNINPPIMVAALQQLGEVPVTSLASFEFVPPGVPFVASPGVAPLDPEFVAHGADVDPATGDIWVSGALAGAQLDTPTLLQVDLNGTELDRLSPDLGGQFLRGLAFDDGRMFVGTRDIVNTVNRIVELDPATGAIIDSFVLPAEYGGTMAALAGGHVVPEPTSLLLVAATAGMVAAYRKQAGSSHRF